MNRVIRHGRPLDQGVRGHQRGLRSADKRGEGPPTYSQTRRAYPRLALSIRVADVLQIDYIRSRNEHLATGVTMLIGKIGQTALAAMLALLTTGSVAHASYLVCEVINFAPDDNEPWRTFCPGSSAIYADVHINPTDEGGTYSIHITDHLDCEGDTRLECGISSTRGNTVACLNEQDSVEDQHYDGHLGELLLFCGCISPEETCEVVLNGGAAIRAAE
jgi:hypothetical protein